MPYRDSANPDALARRRKYDAARRAERKAYDAEHGNKKRAQRRRSVVTFAGVDGEGADINGRHEYLMLRAGENLLDERRPLSAADCLNFLARLPGGVTYVAFSFDYDATMILRDLPKVIVGRILDRESRTYIDNRGRLCTPMVRYRDWLIDYMPRKHFAVAFAGPKPRVVTVHDTIGFFQSSFVDALEKWDVGTADQRAQIAEGKGERANLISYGHDETVAYNHTECILLAELITQLRDVASAMGYSISPYEGAGCLASSMLKTHLGKPPPLAPEEVNRHAQMAYYGGWFEPLAHGQINQPVQEADIASAYPYAMLQLPCLEHGTWHKVHGRPRTKLYLAHITWKAKPGAYVPFGPLPHRDDKGIISRPLSGAGWYWSSEIPTYDTRWTFDIDEAYAYSRCCQCKPFEWIRDVFEERRRLGKSAKGYVLKLGLNSLYGKMAQSIGAAPWANPVYASLITAITRRRIYDLAVSVMLASSRQIEPIMFATDAVFFIGGSIQSVIDLNESGELGSWETKRFESLHLIQAGMYYDDDGFKMKTRGIRASALKKSLRKLRKQYHRHGLEASVRVRYRQLLGIRLAYHQNRLEDAGNWFKVEKVVGYDYSNKRASVYRTRNGVTLSKPHAVREPFESVGYGKNIGGLVRAKFAEDIMVNEADPTI